MAVTDRSEGNLKLWRQAVAKAKGCARAVAALTLLLAVFATQPAHAQTVEQFTNSSPAAITDLTCGGSTADDVIRTFNVTDNFTVLDVDIGINLSHTWRADVRMTLTAPNGTVRIIANNNGGDGDNWNDLFNDEAASNLSAHAASTPDPLTPMYHHSYRPNQLFNTFDNINANGLWTLSICDDAGADVGTFNQATLYLTRAKLTVSKTSSVVTDTISGSNPKAIPGARVRYCVLITNPTTTSMTNVAPSDTLPSGMTYFPNSLRSGTSCAGATTVEDEDNAGVDETNPVGMALSGSTITGNAPTLAAGASFAMTFEAVVN